METNRMYGTGSKNGRRLFRSLLYPQLQECLVYTVG